MAEQWRGLDDKTKKEYEEKAKEQTAKTEAEGRLQPVSNGYMLFVADTHSKVRVDNPGHKFGEITRLVG